MTETMQRVRVAAINEVVVEDVPIPVPGPGEALVRTRLAGICGSDTHAVAGHHPLLPPPYVPGHEAVGDVAAIGEDVTGLTIGQRVILEPNVWCGRCVNCLAGRTNACLHLAWVGCDPSGALPGAMAEYFVAPARSLVAAPAGISDEAAALVECLATPVHAARIAGDLTGARVAVIGAGTIGLFSVIAAQLAGAASVVVTDLEQGKRERALRSGAAAALDGADAAVADAVREALGGPADVVFDCVGIESSLSQAVDMVRRAATILVVGVPPRPAVVRLPLVQDWELRIQGCANYTHADVLRACEIAASGQLPAHEIVTAVRPISEAVAAFAEASANSSGKVEVDPRR